jgi:aminomuconate-semialdehyde/2-hydroxymuconate-6-semialdehyde dehydrogenase
MEKIPNFIDGTFVEPGSGRYLDNFEPATGHVYSQVADSDKDDLEKAVSAAQKAFPKWSTTPVDERMTLLRRIADMLDRSAELLAQAESIDTGKPITLSRTLDIPRCSKNLRTYASAMEQFAGELYEGPPGVHNHVVRGPLGVVAVISPWNLPLYLLTWKVAPALAAGNTVIAKPSEVTPMTAHLFAKICQEAGLPPGVFNLVHGNGRTIGPLISAHPKIRAVSFTGGTQTGADIVSKASSTFKKLTLELGGKNPTILFSNCDYNRMLETTVRSAFLNQGQICTCGSRILVERNLYDRFKEDFVRKAKELVIGDPSDPKTTLGAVVSKPHMEKILGYIDLARKEGGNVLTGGARREVGGRCKEGYFIEPTIVEGLSMECRTNQEEIFGPFVTVAPFDTEAQALEWGNATPYGLAANVWTNDLAQAHRLSRGLQYGVVWVNCWMQRDLRAPFGGTKNSGVGREGGTEALRFFTEPKTICVQYE